MSEELAPCPLRPICVCSRADALPRHRVEPFALSGDPAAAFARLKGVVERMERTEILAATDDYLHAACRTRVGFIDDLECRLSPAEGVIHVRSASRAFYALYDSGVNRQRVERIRRALREAE